MRAWAAKTEVFLQGAKAETSFQFPATRFQQVMTAWFELGFAAAANIFAVPRDFRWSPLTLLQNQFPVFAAVPGGGDGSKSPLVFAAGGKSSHYLKLNQHIRSYCNTKIRSLSSSFQTEILRFASGETFRVVYDHKKQRPKIQRSEIRVPEARAR